MFQVAVLARKLEYYLMISHLNDYSSSSSSTTTITTTTINNNNQSSAHFTRKYNYLFFGKLMRKISQSILSCVPSEPIDAHRQQFVEHDGDERGKKYLLHKIGLTMEKFAIFQLQIITLKRPP